MILLGVEIDCMCVALFQTDHIFSLTVYLSVEFSERKINELMRMNYVRKSTIRMFTIILVG